MKAETTRLNKQRCDILVATPGRMIDHLENSNLKPKLANLRALILDEADRLLEQGFRKEIVRIIDCLPKRNVVPRQTLLFSATVPAQVHQVSRTSQLTRLTVLISILGRSPPSPSSPTSPSSRPSPRQTPTRTSTCPSTRSPHPSSTSSP